MCSFGAFSLPVICAPRPPIILVSIDTLRADHLSAYGYRALKTPHLDAWAEAGTRFANAGAPIPLTLPSHLSLFTSTYPFTNGIDENAQVVPPGTVTLAAILHLAGYKTAAFIGSVFLEKELGLDQGFDLYDSPFRFTAFSTLTGSMFAGDRDRNPYSVRESRPAALVARAAERWVLANRGQPLFAFLHLFDMHKPYRLPPGFARPAGLSNYDAQLLYVDQVLGRFRDALVRSGIWDRALVILLSDHGESLGDHGETSHGYFIYQSTLHVPLLVHWPAGEPPHPALVREPVSLLDVAPTILELLEIPAPKSFAGVSLLNSVPPHPVLAESLHTHHSFGWAPLYSIREGPLKYIEAPKPELYNLATDPGEQRNLLHLRPADTARLRKQLTTLLARTPPGPPSPPAADSRLGTLRSLGYLAPGPRARHGANLADPKDRLPEFRIYENAIALLGDRRPKEAIAELRKLLALDPRNILARRDLGGAYLETGSLENARLNLAQVAAEAPDDYVTLYLLGVACSRLGRLPEARRYLETACRLAPGAAQCREELEKARRPR
ncbi:MAG: sulfatase-like hydrolase/transferase [Acidobacteria bacterium]|nr:sulfatase-like hydrolase/transferase [Acidobacteriota bacterium]